ncbi:MAG: amidohydrolase family protein [Planctomycetes bacterium]|nr:amidohydrolase family protein [Planctomycetota bacterium]
MEAQGRSSAPQAESIRLAGRLFPDGRPVRVTVIEGTIREVEPVDSLAEPDGTQRWIVPGFFDLQVNGFAGRSFANPNLRVEDVESIARAMLSTGVTRLLPTVVTADLDVLGRQLAVIAQAMEELPLVAAMCPGIHVEGPFISPEDGPRGAHRRQYVRDPSIADYERLWASSRGRIAILTLAPERPGGIELIRHVTARGVVAALGHHRADSDALEQAIAAGARISTHLGNGTDAVLPRLAGNYIWDQLGDDRLWASFIADGHHLPPATLRCMIRAKCPSRSILVTDATELAGMLPGRYRHNEFEVELTADGKIVIPDTSYLAGSAATMPSLIGRTVADAGLSFVEAVRLATLQPAALLEGGSVRWSCRPGEPANLVELIWRPPDASVTLLRAVIGPFSHWSPA